MILILLGGMILSMVLSAIFDLDFGGQAIIGITCGLGVLHLQRQLKVLREAKAK